MAERINVNRRVLRASTAVLIFAVLPPSLGAGGQPPDTAKDSKSAGNLSDFFEKYKDEYTATEEPRFVDLDPVVYLSITGQGEPGSELFLERMKALYTVANAIHTRYTTAGRPYPNGPLEQEHPLDIGMRSGAPQNPQDKRIVKLQIGAENGLSPQALFQTDFGNILSDDFVIRFHQLFLRRVAHKKIIHHESTKEWKHEKENKKNR